MENTRLFIFLNVSELHKIFSYLGNGDKIVCEMKVLYIYTIRYVCSFICRKRYVDKVTENGFQAIIVSGDVEK